MNELNLITKNPLVQKIAAGDANEELLELLLDKRLPLTDEEYLESLVFLVANENLKKKALKLLKNIPEQIKINYVEKIQANPRIAYFIVLEALNMKNLNILIKVIHNQAFPYEFLLKIAEKGDAASLEALLENQIKLIAYPQIMDVMELNPGIDNFIKGKIHELKDFYLKEGTATEIPFEEILEDVKDIFVEEIKAAGDENKTAEVPLAVIEEKALTELQMINKMSVSDRMKLALVGTKTQRTILIKDSNKMVMNAVVASPKLSADEVILFIRNKSTPGEIIGKIADNREWIKNYQVVLSLVQNPKTPIKSALGFIKMLHLKDLQQVVKDKNMNPVIRTLAVNFFKQKTKVKG
ncbi:MAG: hypothetical protein L0Y73_03920 [Candidatus Aminicenantes bacterium]|nr:hypothetical protein [Candidatus Aminicenantes bacterium]